MSGSVGTVVVHVEEVSGLRKAVVVGGGVVDHRASSCLRVWTVASAARLRHSRQILAVVSEGGIVCKRLQLHTPVDRKVIRLMPVVTHCVGVD